MRLARRVFAPLQALRARQKRATGVDAWIMQRNPAHARPFFRDAVRIFANARGDSMPLVPYLAEAALCSHQSGELEEAEEYLRRAVSIMDKHPDGPALAVAHMHQRLGRVLEDRQKLAAAEQSFVSALKLLKSYPVPFVLPFKSEADMKEFAQQFGVNFASSAEKSDDINSGFKDELAELRHQIIADLAMVLEKQERWDDADPLHRHVVLTQAEALRADLPHVAFSLQLLPLPEDVELSARTLEWQQQRLGQDNPALTCSLYAHAFALLASRRFAESEKLLHRIATIQRIHRGTNHPAMAAALASLGRLKATEKKWREAEDYLQRAWDIRKAALTPYHIHSALTLFDVGITKQYQHKYSDAHDSYEEAVLCLKPQLGAHHPYLHRMNETFLKFDEEMRKAAASAGKTSGITEVMQGKHIVQQPPSGASLKV